MLIGSHVGMGGKDKMLGSVKEALSYGANCFMIYTGAPQNTRRSAIETLKVEEAHQLMKDNDLKLENIVIHAPYIMNLANPSPEKREYAVSFLTNEVIRTDKLGATQIVLHPGSHLTQDLYVGLDNIIEGLKKVLNNTKDLRTLIALETMAGKGTECGKTFAELAYIIKGVNSDRITVCFDTCHVNDSGYDLNNLDKVFADFDQIVGKEKITAFHINDSKNPRSAKKDRHQNIGLGHIGFDALKKIIYHQDFLNIPKILETPYVENLEGNMKFPPYKHEILMIKKGKMNDQLLDTITNTEN